MSGKKHTAINNFFQHLSAAGKELKNQNIDNFVDAQLACIKVYLEKLVQNKIINEVKILKKFYSVRNEQIAQYFITLKCFKNILYSVFYK